VTERDSGSSVSRRGVKYMERRGSKSVYFIASMLEGYLFLGDRALEMTPQGNNIGFKTSLFDVSQKSSTVLVIFF
jgi:hypothetical protein